MPAATRSSDELLLRMLDLRKTGMKWSDIGKEIGKNKKWVSYYASTIRKDYEASSGESLGV